MEKVRLRFPTRSPAPLPQFPRMQLQPMFMRMLLHITALATQCSLFWVILPPTLLQFVGAIVLLSVSVFWIALPWPVLSLMLTPSAQSTPGDP